jgi:hypothetical protein
MCTEISKKLALGGDIRPPDGTFNLRGPLHSSLWVGDLLDTDP